nr:uncharacterized protein LOC108084643 [Drosophila kikkawai]XP_017036424.1 uncharacterized protein LOC108084643 [Drosophila kikkawai]
MGEGEKKAFRLFLREYIKVHPGMEREDLNWKGINAWGRLNPSQKEMFVEKSTFEGPKEAKPNVIQVPPLDPNGNKAEKNEDPKNPSLDLNVIPNYFRNLIPYLNDVDPEEIPQKEESQVQKKVTIPRISIAAARKRKQATKKRATKTIKKIAEKGKKRATKKSPKKLPKKKRSPKKAQKRVPKPT